MLAKVIAHGPDRAAAVARLDAALADTRIAGVEHNVAFLRRLLGHAEFRSGTYTTHLIDEAGDTLTPSRDDAEWICAALAVQRLARRDDSPWGRADGFRINQAAAFVVEFSDDDGWQRVCLLGAAAELGDQRFSIALLQEDGDRLVLRIDDMVVDATVTVAGDDVFVMRGGDTRRLQRRRPDVAALAGEAGGAGRIVAPMPGQVIAVSVAVGDSVTAGQVLLVIEAMKMEHSVAAPRDGTVATLACGVGDRVEDGVELVTFES